MEQKTVNLTTWNIDRAHSEVMFKVKHLVISTVSGKFKTFDAHADMEGDNFETAEIYFEAETKSIDTGQEQRDAHLQSDDFFNSETFPKLIFRSASMRKVKGDIYEITGDVTIRDITKTITLTAEYGGTMVDPYGNLKAGFEITGKISRKDFGLKWNAVTEAGGVVVGDEVSIHANVQFLKANN